MKLLAFLLFLSVVPCVVHAAANVDIFTAKDLQALAKQAPAKGSEYADHHLGTYGNHYLLFVRRDKTGSSELHAHEADVFVVESGSGVLVTGGRLIGAHTTKPGEMRGTSIQGGTRRPIGVGDAVHIPAGVPHQVLVNQGDPFTYFVVKISGQ